jgi:hypothetical protein
MAWAASGQPVTDDGWRRLVTRIEDMPVPEFPLQGSDIVQLGVPQGPAVGKILKSVEAHWTAGGCTAGNTELLEMARELISSKTGES